METVNDKVWLVVNIGMIKDDVVSIWTTKELANSAVLFHKAQRPQFTYRAKEWQLNVTIPQWD